MEDTYSYFTRRPIDIGTIPTEPDNQPIEIEHYDERIPVNGETFYAWGKATYTKPLTTEQVKKFELRPSHENPDVRRDMEMHAQAVGAWEKANKIPEQKRLTFRKSPDVPFVVKKGVSQSQLSMRFQFALEHPKITVRKKKQRKPPGRSR